MASHSVTAEEGSSPPHRINFSLKWAKTVSETLRSESKEGRVKNVRKCSALPFKSQPSGCGRIIIFFLICILQTKISKILCPLQVAQWCTLLTGVGYQVWSTTCACILLACPPQWHYNGWKTRHTNEATLFFPIWFCTFNLYILLLVG